MPKKTVGATTLLRVRRVQEETFVMVLPLLATAIRVLQRVLRVRGVRPDPLPDLLHNQVLGVNILPTAKPMKFVACAIATSEIVR